MGQLSEVSDASCHLVGTESPTDQFYVNDLTTSTGRWAAMEGFDGWVWGMAVVDDVLIVMDIDRVQRAFDPSTGDVMGSLELPGVDSGDQLYGLVCDED